MKTVFFFLLLTVTTAFTDTINSPCMDSLFIYLKRERKPGDLTVEEQKYVDNMNEKCIRFKEEDRVKEKDKEIRGYRRRGVVLVIMSVVFISLLAVSSIVVFKK